MTSVTLRQAIERIRHRLLFVPLVFVAGSVALSRAMIATDRVVGNDQLPQAFETTVENGRAILSTIAGGLIASITLLLSLMLVAVQLGNSQFSPRTLRNWVGDPTQRRTIGIVLGTTVYCLLALRSTRTVAEGEALIPHLTVLLAVALGVISLVAVVRSVDHLTNSLRIGSVAGRLSQETISMIRDEERLADLADPTTSPAGPDVTPVKTQIPPGAFPIEAQQSGWVQQIDEKGMLEAMPAGSTAFVTTTLGSFVMTGTPIAWVWPGGVKHDSLRTFHDSIAIGDTRTMQQDIGFGILQMVDIALRALSPGVNDPNTANDLIAHLGAVMLAIWEIPSGPRERVESDKRLIRPDHDHGDFLHAAFDQIRRYGASDIHVAEMLLRTLDTLRSETERRQLPGPIAPIVEIARQLVETVDASDALGDDKIRIHAAAADLLDGRTAVE